MAQIIFKALGVLASQKRHHPSILALVYVLLFHLVILTQRA
jgi:hypothetical protein